MLTLWKRKFFIKWSMTSKVIQGQKRRHFYLKIHFFFCFVCAIDWLKKKMLLKIMKEQDDICLVQRRHVSYTKTKSALRIIVYLKIWIFLKMKYYLRSYRTTLMLSRGCVASYFQILWQPWLTFLWTTFVLFLSIVCLCYQYKLIVYLDRWS